MSSQWRSRLVTYSSRMAEAARASFIGACARRMVEIGSRDRAVTIAGQAFIALVPLLVVLASWTRSSGEDGAGEAIIAYFALSGPSADAVRALFETPPTATGGASLIGLVILFVSIGSFSRALQRLYETTWRLPHRGMRGTLSGLMGLSVLVAVLFGHGWLVHVLDTNGVPRGGRLVIETVTILPLWALSLWCLVSRRIGYRLLLVSAAVSAGGQVLLSWWTRLYVPHLIQTDAERYGVIGVAFALVSWLVLVAYLLVVSAVVGAEVTDRIQRADPPLLDRLRALPRRDGTAPPPQHYQRSRGTPRSSPPQSS